MAGRKPTISDKEILQVFGEHRDPALVTGEVADAIGFSHQGTLKRLDSLSENGYLKTKKPGRERIWWLSQAGRECVSNG